MTAVYACLGNHDAGKTASQMLTFLEQANIHLLSDTYTVIVTSGIGYWGMPMRVGTDSEMVTICLK